LPTLELQEKKTKGQLHIAEHIITDPVKLIEEYRVKVAPMLARSYGCRLHY